MYFSAIPVSISAVSLTSRKT
jgi:hypothetical protein